MTISARFAAALGVLLSLLPGGLGMAAAQPEGALEPLDHAICRLIESAARANHLAVAAAAYNAGPARVAGWLNGQGELPAETRAYVRFVAGRAAGEWIDPAGYTPAGDFDPEPVSQSCVALTAELRHDRGDGIDDGLGEDGWGFAPLAPWGVQLAGNFSKARALAAFERTRQRYAAILGEGRPMIIGRLLRSRGTRRFYQIRLPAASRQVAEMLCSRLHAVGGNCIALRS